MCLALACNHVLAKTSGLSSLQAWRHTLLVCLTRGWSLTQSKTSGLSSLQAWTHFCCVRVCTLHYKNPFLISTPNMAGGFVTHPDGEIPTSHRGLESIITSQSLSPYSGRLPGTRDIASRSSWWRATCLLVVHGVSVSSPARWWWWWWCLSHCVRVVFGENSGSEIEAGNIICVPRRVALWLGWSAAETAGARLRQGTLCVCGGASPFGSVGPRRKQRERD